MRAAIDAIVGIQYEARRYYYRGIIDVTWESVYNDHAANPLKVHAVHAHHAR